MANLLDGTGSPILDGAGSPILDGSSSGSGGAATTVSGAVAGGTLGASGSAFVAVSNLTVSGSASGGDLRARGALVAGEVSPPPPTGLLPTPAVNNWLSGTPVDAATLNLYVNDAFTFLSRPPLLRVQQTTGQSGLAPNQWQVITFQDSLEDTYSGWAGYNIGNVYVAQVPGWYAISLIVSANLPGSTIAHAGIQYWSNAAGVYVGPFEFDQQASGASGGSWSWNCYDETYLQAGDLVIPMFYAQANASYSTNTQYPSTFEVSWISS